MDNIVKAAFVSQKRDPNVRLQRIISRVAEQYFSDTEALEEDQLAQIWAAGKANLSLPKKKDNRNG